MACSKNQLILSPHNDINASAVEWGLARAGFSPLWSKSGSLMDHQIGSLSIFSDGQSSWIGENGLRGDRFSAVWHRWTRHPEVFPNAAASDTAFLKTEWRAFESNVYALNSEALDALWINRPESAVRAENKLVQLQVAARVGIRFPRTLVSSDPHRIRQFIAENVRTIYKPFIPHTWENAKTGSWHQVPAAIIERPDDLDDASFSLCPGIYQNFIEKACDIRVTVIGNRLFAAKIQSQSGSAYVDWRSHTKESGFCSEPYTLPPAYEENLKRLMQALDIVYGCIDLVVDKTGDIVFLEVNQVGQYLFMERWDPSLPLLQAMCAMLAEGRTDYSLESCRGVNYQDYLNSDNFLEFRDHANEERQKTVRDSPMLSVEHEGTA